MDAYDRKLMNKAKAAKAMKALKAAAPAKAVAMKAMKVMKPMKGRRFRTHVLHGAEKGHCVTVDTTRPCPMGEGLMVVSKTRRAMKPKKAMKA